MNILALVAVGAGTFGAGLFFGAIVLKPQVGPWYGRRPAPAAPVTAMTRLTPELTMDATALQNQMTVYVLTDRGLTPVPLALPAATPTLPVGVIPPVKEVRP